ncbi:quaternary ammonium transporter [Vibrio ponticus]|uniref:Multidrug efflux SMR transporter n=1 Tax=Vibrio ponticus TaxID=265668 RepID=A0A3N3DTL8_9VIBR|nr:multidrug efflux SMR transporter [Vibrio ponticus]OLQ94437.1 quaternary ammonium transporter [Vibrio ponticus]ROV57847.1 multidrug efflux SMR transporter [Vibrio ponticus]
MSWLFIIFAVLSEALSHVALKATDGFSLSKPLPAMFVIVGHLAAFLFLSQAMKGMAVGVVHSLWAGLAIVAVSLISTFVYRQHLEPMVWGGIALVVVGVMMINFSQGHVH